MAARITMEYEKELALQTFNMEMILEKLSDDIIKSRTGNKRAARRARVALIKLEKLGKAFRKLTMKRQNGEV